MAQEGHVIARRLIAARALRSIGQGALMVDFALYARALGWSASFLGAVLAGGYLFNGIATSLGGPASDRLGRRPFLLAYEAIAFASALVATASAASLLLASAAILAGYGRGANGTPAFFGVIEQAWLARSAPREGFARLFSRNTAAGFFGTAAGAVLAALPTLWAPLLPGATAYRPLFLLAALGEAVAFFLIFFTEDPKASPGPEQTSRPPLKPEERRLLFRLAAVNSLNGLGLGLVAPLITWWFAARYGVGPAAIGPALGAILFVSGFAAIVAGWIGTRFGEIRVVVAMRSVGLLLLFVLPFAPLYWIAILLYGGRIVLNRSTAGPRQALALGLIQVERRGLAATVNSFSMLLPRALGPAIGGLLFAAGSFTAPFILAALLQGAYIALFPMIFAGQDLGSRALARPEKGS